MLSPVAESPAAADVLGGRENALNKWRQTLSFTLASWFRAFHLNVPHEVSSAVFTTRPAR